MAKQGKCNNIDCDHYKEVFSIQAGEEFECPHCHQPLGEVEGGKADKKKKNGGSGPNGKLIVVIVGALVVLAGIGFTVWKFLGSGSEIEKIKLDKKNITLVVGQKDVIKATVVDKDGNEIKDVKVKFSWSVKDGKTASVTQGGEVEALKKGETAITVKIEGDEKNLRATCKVKVKVGKDPVNTLVTKLSIEQSQITLKEGEQTEIKLSVEPSNHTEEIIAESNNPGVASIENGGIIKANKAGNALILIKTSKSGKTATVNVTVEPKEGPGGGGNGWGKENLGYGIYEGYRKNHKPHGHGTIRYTKSHQIVSWKDFTASPGDTFEGEFRDGKITGMGYWKHNGNVTAIQ